MANPVFKTVGNLATEMQATTWDDIVGQTPAKKILFGMLKSRKIKQSFFFTGERGIGKTSMVRLLAATLNCAAPDLETFNPCGKCRSCKAMFSSENPKHPDYSEIDCAANGLIENTRRIMDYSANMPQFNYRVICLDEAQQMGKPAQASLLKSFQAPKPHVIFAIATTDPQNILDTIISRCVQLHLKTPTTKENVRLLRSIAADRDVNIPPEVLTQIAANAENHTRDCINLLGSVMDAMNAESEPIAPEAMKKWVSALLGTTPWKLVSGFCRGMFDGDVNAVIENFHVSQSRVQFVKSVHIQLANILVYRSNPQLLEFYVQKEADSLNKKIPGKAGYSLLLDMANELGELFARIQGYTVDAEAACLPFFIRYARKFRAAAEPLQ